MADLRSATACSTIAVDLYTPDGALWSTSALRPFVGDLVQPSAECLAWARCGREYCREALQSGKADIWLDDKNALHTYQMQELDECTQMASVGATAHSSLQDQRVLQQKTSESCSICGMRCFDLDIIHTRLA